MSISNPLAPPTVHTDKSDGKTNIYMCCALWNANEIPWDTSTF